MKTNIRNTLSGIVLGLALMTLCEPARADLVGGAYLTTNNITSWSTNFSGGVLPEYTSLNNANLGGTSGQGQPSAGGGASYTVLSETFTPVVQFTLTGIGIQASHNTAGTGLSLHIFDVTTNLTSNNGTILNGSGATYTTTNTADLLGNGNGLSFNVPGSSGLEQEFFGLTNGPTSNDQIILRTNHNYTLEIWSPVSASGAFVWFKNSVADSGGEAMGGHDATTNVARLTLASLGLAGGAPRTYTLALYSTNYVNPGASTNAVTTLLNPVPAVYGPPTVWPYTAGIAAGTDTTNTDVSFGANTVMGEAFLVTRALNLRDFYFAMQGTTNSGKYLLVLNDLGAGAATNYGNSFNPAPFTGANLLAHPSAPFLQYWSFTPNGLTNKTIVKFKFSGTDAVTLTSGHSYFLGFVSVGGSNDMVLERTSAGQTDLNGAAYQGSTTSVANNGFGPSNRNLLMGVDVLNPNLVVSVTNYPLAGSWPVLAGETNGGVPFIQTLTDPSAAEPSNGAGVQEGVANGVALSMGFIATNDFNLGAIALTQRGIGSSNCLFTIAIYDVTNNFFSQGTNGSVNKWPKNYQPNIDTDPKGIPVFGTNIDFYYTADNGVNGAGQGTNDQILVLTLNNPANQVLLHSNHVYQVEITVDVFGNNANTVGLFQWIRDVGQTAFEINLFPDLGDGIQFAGYRTNAASANLASYILPGALTRTFTDPEQFAGQVAGASRDFVMGIYGAPPAPAVPTSITITSVSRTGNTVNLSWNPTPAGTYTYSVLSKTNLTDAAWVTNATGISTTSYPDTTAAASTRFYRVRSP